MADQEMEMGVDFGPADFAEDIDIDLDFPAGEPDEDMDLGDFDRLHGVHNFNSDTRDELMGEGDDASYNMIDAIEIEHNASSTPANDIDLDLEHAVESIWQQNPPQAAEFHLDSGIEYLDGTSAEHMDAERIDTDTGEWMQSGMNSQNALEISLDGGEPEEIFTGAQEIQEELLLEGSATWLKETSGAVELSHPEAEAVYSSAASNLQEGTHPIHVNDLPGNEVPEEVPEGIPENSTEEITEDITKEVAEEVAEEVTEEVTEEVREAVPQAPDREVEVEENENGFVQPVDDNEATPHRPKSYLQNSNEQQEARRSIGTAEVASDHADIIPVSHELEQLEHTEVTELVNVEQDQAEDADDFIGATSDPQTAGESYIEATSDQTGVDDATRAEHASIGRSGSPSSESNPQSLDGRENKVAPTDPGALAAEVGVRDDPIELADHYGVYIAYGDTNYRLFAKSEDDDPNQYFLTDTSVLDVPLVQFLANLRDVISEEVSPLDDLVMQVDGLGLEFSESTTPDFLGKYTFGDLVILYDKLVKNEQTEVLNPIHTYLTVKPNCSRRMMALGESANAGRGLSEVGLYHESVDSEQADVADSLDTDSQIGSPIPLEDGTIDDHTGDEGRQDSPLATVDMEPEHAADSDDDPSEEPDDSDQDKEETAVSDSADVISHEEDASISTQVEDHTANESAILETQETNEPDHEEQTSPKISESSESKVKEPETWPQNSSADATNSENTSVTATLDGEDGEDGDEIDYNSDEDQEDDDEELDESNVQEQTSGITSVPSAPVDDEITWESDEEEEEEEEEEEANNEIQDGLNTDTVQVSPVSGKRSRSDSDALDDAGDKNDNKRRRP